MADTSVLLKIERYVTESIGDDLVKKKLRLVWGGDFEVDGVSTERRLAILASTSAISENKKTPPPGIVRKILSDVLFLTALEGDWTKRLYFTDRSVYDYFVTQQRMGRFPPADVIHIEFFQLPEDKLREVKAVRDAASKEVSPSNKQGV